MEKQTFVPKEFYCPITGELMINPMSDPNGNSYEKESIIEWLSKNETSPITREPLTIHQLNENIALKRSIDEIREKISEQQLRIETSIQEETPYINVLEDSIIDLRSYYMNDKLFVNINVPDTKVRAPIDVVLCIDISGSMGTEATLKGDSNETISHGFSILSLTVSASKTVLNSLNKDDNISIVTYSDRAHVLVEQIACTIENKKLIEMQLDTLKPTATTNMWDGIHVSLDILRTKSLPHRMKGILLLTDGIPNIEPPRGHEDTLNKYFRDYNFKCGISCYGFGYDLNSELLMEISKISGGDGYSFIPDASLLGNVFIHGISNMLSTAVCYPTLNIKLSNDVKFMGGSTEMNIEIDSLKYGKSKNLIFSVDTRGCSSRSLDHFRDCAEIALTYGEKQIRINECIMPPPNYYNEQISREKMIDVINLSLSKNKFRDKSYESNIYELAIEMEKEKMCPYIGNLLYDLNGQIKESLNMTREGEREDWFSRWGIHYLRSLQNAYQNEICNNFKDKGVSNFAIGIFNTIRDEVSDIFDEIPPPKQDVKTTTIRGGGSSRVKRQATPVNMRSYNNQGGGCCAEGCRVLMKDQSYKKVEELQKGDRVITFKIDKKIGHEEYSDSEIECVIKTKCTDNKIDMVTIENLKITPYHPILLFNELNINKNWRFPIMVHKPETIECEYMYTFILVNRESMLIERSVFATYGHMIEDEIIKHNYFGTDKVINDLKVFPGYNNGLVELRQDNFIRDLDNNVIVSIKQ